MRIEDSVKVSNLVSLVYTIKGHYNLFVENGNIDDFDISNSYYDNAISIIDKLLNVVDDTETVETTDTIDDTETTEKKVLKMKGLKGRSFKININGLEKSYSCSTEEVETSYGYKDFVCKMEAKSTILIDGEYALIKAYVEVYDGVVTYMNICRDNNHLQLESFLDSMNDNRISRKVDTLIDNIKYEVNSYIYEKDFNFAESVMTMVLNLNSFDTNTWLYNEETYNLVDVA